MAYVPEDTAAGFAVAFRGEVVALRGELDIASAHTLEAALDLAADTAGPLVLDLADLAFIDSSGLAGLVRIHKRLAPFGGRLVLRNPVARVRRVLAISGLDQVLQVED